MRSKIKIAIVLLAGVATGGLAVEGLHAQAKAPVYLVTEIDVSNPEAYAKEYAPKAQANIKAAGGRYLALAGAAGGTGKITAIEGEAPKRVSVLVWDSVEKVQTWRKSAEFQEIRKIGNEYAKFRSFAVEALPQ